MIRKSEREVREVRRVMKEREEAGEWWGRARHRRMMGKSEREVRVMAKSRRGTQMMGECKEQSNDGGVQEAHE